MSRAEKRPQQPDPLAKLRELAAKVPDVPNRPFPDEVGKVLQQLLEALRGVR